MSDQFKILVEIAMKDGISSALHVIQRRLMSINDTIDLTTNKFSRMQVAVVGGMAALGGLGMIAGFSKLAEAGGEILDQQQLMLSNGTSLADLTKEMTTATSMVGIGGSNLADNLKMVADLRQLLGGSNLSEAMTLAPVMLKAGIAAGLMTGQDSEKSAYNIALIEDNLGYTLDSHGKMDPARAAQKANLIDAIISGTNGRVGTDDLYAFAKQARTAGRLLSDQGFIDMAPVIQAMGGYRAGTGLQAFDRALVGGVMTTRGTSWLEKLGLLDPKNVHRAESGYARLDPNSIAGSSLMATDPQAWANQVLAPALAKAGATDIPSMLKMILQSGFANTTNGLFAELIGNSVQNAKDVTNIGQAAGTDQYSVTLASLTGATKDFTGALDSLWEALGLPAAQMAVPLLEDVAGGIAKFSQMVMAHQSAVKAVEAILLGIGVGLIVLGSVATISALLAMAGTSGLLAGVAAGIIGLAAALTHLKRLSPNSLRRAPTLTTPASIGCKRAAAAHGFPALRRCPRLPPRRRAMSIWTASASAKCWRIIYPARAPARQTATSAR